MVDTNLPPPPTYDLVVDGFTIAVPPPKSAIPGMGWLRPKSGVSAGTIIRDVSLRCESGEMMAIIGGSGSGKTTLLHALVGRLANLPVTAGQVKYEPAGAPLSADESAALSARKMKDRIGFVRQNDYLLEHLTVRETLDYAAALRLPATISSSTRRLIVDQTVRELGLGDAADTVVGGALRKGISGGERRRLSIALSLISLPSILALDEPTTGLDSFTAYALLQTLSSLAKGHNGVGKRTVVMSVHQPRSDAWDLFDRIVVLSKGDVVFAGRRERCLGWFEGMGDGSPEDRNAVARESEALRLDEKSIDEKTKSDERGTGVNPLDWLIDICSVDPREEGSARRVERLVKGWKEGGKEIAEERGVPSENKTAGVHIPPTSDIHEAGASIQPIRSIQEREQVLLYANSVHEDGQQARLKRPGWVRQTRVLTSCAVKGVSRGYAQLFGFACPRMGVGFCSVSRFRGEARVRRTSSRSTCVSFRLFVDICDLQGTIVAYNNSTKANIGLQFCERGLIIFYRERKHQLYVNFLALFRLFSTDPAPHAATVSMDFLQIYRFPPTTRRILKPFRAHPVVHN